MVPIHPRPHYLSCNGASIADMQISGSPEPRQVRFLRRCYPINEENDRSLTVRLGRSEELSPSSYSSPKAFNNTRHTEDNVESVAAHS